MTIHIILILFIKFLKTYLPDNVNHVLFVCPNQEHKHMHHVDIDVYLETIVPDQLLDHTLPKRNTYDNTNLYLIFI